MLNSGTQSTYIVGLTGGIGSGKSTISSMFAELGIEIIDADEISHAIVKKGEPSFEAIVDHFGTDIIGSNDELDRARLKRLVFDNRDEKKWLEDLLHPLIRKTMEGRIATSQGAYVILAIPLLLESGHYDFVDRVLVVDVPESIQTARIRHRDNLPVELIQQILASQMPRNERLDKADDIIFNDAPIEEVKEHVRKLHEIYLLGMERKTRNG